MIWEIDAGERAIEGLDDHGRPDPAYAQSLGLLPARPSMRACAALLEWTVAIVLALPALLVVVPALAEAVAAGDPASLFGRADLVWIIVALAVSSGLATAYIVVQLVLHGRKGVTLGKAAFGIRSVNVRTLERPGFWRGAVVRYLLAYASLLVPLIGPLLVVALSPLFDVERRGRGWLDLAAATWFVDVRRGLNPYDQKRMRIARKQVKTPAIEERAPLPSLATPVDRDAPAEYVPSARFSGGVIGVHRPAAPSPGAPGAPPATAAAAPSAPRVAQVRDDAGMVSAVPPSLATGASAPAGPAPSAPAPTSVPAPAPAPAVVPPASAPVAPASAPVAPVSAPVAPVSAPVAPASAPVAPVSSPAAPAAAPGPPHARAVLVLDSGQRIEIRGVTLLGRSPAPAAGEGTVQLVQVDDDTRSVSKTHLAVMPARRGVLVVDRASTNGSAIVRGGAELLLVPGQPAELQLGDTVRFGDRTLQVEQL